MKTKTSRCLAVRVVARQLLPSLYFMAVASSNVGDRLMQKILSVITSVEGEEQDFFNEQDRLHMADVKNLFLGGMKVGWICFGAGLVLLGILIYMKTDWKKLFLRAYSMALGVWAIVLAFLGIAFSIDFTRCFTIFHKIFFTNDLWIFDPATDYMIRMLPEGFFFDMVIRIIVTFIVALVLLWGLFYLFRKIGKKDQ